MNMNPVFEASQTSLPFAPGYAAPVTGPYSSIPSGLAEQGCHYDAPRLIRSVVSQAGLGRFVYLQGKSERRYVFSAISPEQVSLYDRALFAVINPRDGAVTIFDEASAVSQTSQTLYVHLLSDVEGECMEHAKADLGL